MQLTMSYGEPYMNRGLFADNFLDTRLPELQAWRQTAGMEAAFRAISDLYRQRAAKFGASTNEAQTEADFIRPVLDLLWGGDAYQVQVSLPNLGAAARQPDYALFGTAAERDAAEEHQGTPDYWTNVACVGDAKRWTASLDKERGAENPSAQITNYLYRSKVRWGILTNGRQWRLYEQERSRQGGVYFEVDLVQLLINGNLDDFRWFYLFFRREAVLPDQDGKSFLERVLEGSVTYAAEAGDRLKESVYDALRLLIGGFLDHAGNQLDRHDPATLRLVHDNALIVLYRLLFLFYAEDRRLLPYEQDPYADVSLFRLHHEVNARLRSGGAYTAATRQFWPRLMNLFELIDQGFPEGGIPEYNGGLFSPRKHPHVAYEAQDGCRRWEVGDLALSQVIDLLAYDREPGAHVGHRDIDYATLAVQHLGSIYEGLLELQPRLATAPLVEVVKGKSAKFEPEADVSKPDPHARRIPTDGVYLATDRGERKATGSYYTPKYIVDYIVEHTIDPLVSDAAKEVAALKSEVDARVKTLTARRDSIPTTDPATRDRLAHDIEAERGRLLEPYLSLKILDPAMGSGHFLVGAADFLSLAMATDPNLPAPEIGDEDPQLYFKRLVVERCLYGVDLNPLSVELAKLSLWLHTVSSDRALSFLDHHLRCGNSLIGARLTEDLSTEPPRLDSRGKVVRRNVGQLSFGFTETLRAKHLQYLLDTFRRIAEAPAGDAASERSKARWYDAMDQVRDRFRKVANCWIAPYFGGDVTADQYGEAVEWLRGALTPQSPFPEAAFTPRPPLLAAGEGESGAVAESPLSPRGRGVGGEGADQWTISPAMHTAMAELARRLRRESTPSENTLWQALRGRRLDGWKFRRQQPIGPFVVDFFCAEARLIVEVDGAAHDDPEQLALDRERQALLESLGLRFLRVRAAEVEHRLARVLELIREALTPQPPLPAAGEGESGAVAESPLSPRGRGVGGEGVADAPTVTSTSWFTNAQHLATTRRFFHWELEFPEAFLSATGRLPVNERGFDAVIGNPPYVRQEQLSEQKAYFGDRYAEVYHGQADLFVYFFGHGLELLKPGRRLSYISSNSWLQTNFAEPLRRQVRTAHTVEELLDLGDNRVFTEAPGVWPAIFVIRRSEPSTEHRFNTVVFAKGEEPRLDPGTVRPKTLPVLQADQPDAGWQLTDDATRRLVAKLMDAGRPLGEVVDGRMYRGVLTGLNDAFIIDQATRDRLVAEDAGAAEVLKPLVRGEDLRPWYQEEEGRWLIRIAAGWTAATFGPGLTGAEAWSRFAATYPSVAAWLEPFTERGRKRQDKGDYWWELRPCVYYDVFEEPKILWPDIAFLPRFSWDESALFTNNTCYLMATPAKWLCGWLNSRCGWMLITQLAVKLSKGGVRERYRLFDQYLRPMSTPSLLASDERTLGALTASITETAQGRSSLARQAGHRLFADLGTPDSKLNQKLTAWWDLDWAGLRAEVKRCFKHDIPVAERDQWEAWFAAQKAEHERLTGRIVDLETELNDRVYHLYDLTRDEIAIVERETKYQYGEV